MAAWKPGAGKIKAKASHGFGKELLQLAADIKMAGDGKIMIASAAFRAWRTKLSQLAEAKKSDLAEQILILASRYFREMGEQATDAVAQLLVLAGDLTGAVLSQEPAPSPRASAPKPSAPKPAASRAKAAKKPVAAPPKAAMKPASAPSAAAKKK